MNVNRSLNESCQLVSDHVFLGCKNTVVFLVYKHPEAFTTQYSVHNYVHGSPNRTDLVCLSCTQIVQDTLGTTMQICLRWGIQNGRNL